MTERYQKTRLGNGIRVVSERMDGVKSVSIGVWVCAGSRQENKSHNGVSHLLEHMLFKGTTTRTSFDIATSLESLGGHLNAFTEREFTCFYAVVLEDNLPEAVEVLSDVIQHALLAETDLENEKRIVFEEIKNLEDTPEDYLQEYFLRTVFPDHPLGFSTLGSIDSVGGIQQSDLIAYQKRHYTAENLIVSAAGNLDHDRLTELIQRYFNVLPAGFAEELDPVRWGSTKFKTVYRPTNQTHILIGIPACGYMNPKKFPLIVLDVYLGGGMSSRLFQNIREKQGLAYSVYSFIDFWSDTGLWGVYTGTSPELAQKAMESIEYEFSDILKNRFSEAVLKRICNQIARNILLTLEDPSSRMNRLAKMEAYAKQYTSIDDVVSMIQKVSIEDVHQVAEMLFKNQKRYTVFLESESI